MRERLLGEPVGWIPQALKRARGRPDSWREHGWRVSELSQDLRRQSEQKGCQSVNAGGDTRAILRTACLNFNGPLDLTIEDQRWL